MTEQEKNFRTQMQKRAGIAVSVNNVKMPLNESTDPWISPSHKGLLHKHLGVPEDQNIPRGELERQLSNLKAITAGGGTLTPAQRQLEQEILFALNTPVSETLKKKSNFDDDDLKAMKDFDAADDEGKKKIMQKQLAKFKAEGNPTKMLNWLGNRSIGSRHIDIAKSHEDPSAIAKAKQARDLGKKTSWDDLKYDKPEGIDEGFWSDMKDAFNRGWDAEAKRQNDAEQVKRIINRRLDRWGNKPSPEIKRIKPEAEKLFGGSKEPKTEPKKDEPKGASSTDKIKDMLARAAKKYATGEQPLTHAIKGAKQKAKDVASTIGTTARNVEKDVRGAGEELGMKSSPKKEKDLKDLPLSSWKRMTKDGPKYGSKKYEPDYTIEERFERVVAYLAENGIKFDPEKYSKMDISKLKKAMEEPEDLRPHWARTPIKPGKQLPPSKAIPMSPTAAGTELPKGKIATPVFGKKQEPKPEGEPWPSMKKKDIEPDDTDEGPIYPASGGKSPLEEDGIPFNLSDFDLEKWKKQKEEEPSPKKQGPISPPPGKVEKRRFKDEDEGDYPVYPVEPSTPLEENDEEIDVDQVLAEMEQEIEEMSTTGAVQGFSPANAFSKPDQKTNRAIRQAEKEGWSRLTTEQIQAAVREVADIRNEKMEHIRNAVISQLGDQLSPEEIEQTVQMIYAQAVSDELEEGGLRYRKHPRASVASTPTYHP